MKERLKKIADKTTGALLMILCCFGMGSCSDDALTDKTTFQLFYSDVTDIGPSMSMKLYEPTYIGKKPSDFALTGVTLDGNDVQTECFSIDKETGAIAIENTSGLAIGTYALSVSCRSGGKHYNFKDLVHVNMMRTVPEGITATPRLLEVSYDDVKSKSESELPTSQITTDGKHIHINKYVIANVRHEGVVIANDKLFSVSDKGVIGFGSNHEQLAPGKYIIDMKLTTEVVDEHSEEGLFVNAVEVNVTSRPLTLGYSPDFSKVEAEISETVKSVVPVMSGSLEDLKFEISKVVPATAPVKIDAATGEIMLEPNHLAIGTTCKVGVKVTNKYGATDFPEVYTFTIVPLIHTITKFNYASATEFIEGTSFTLPVKEIDGDGVKYAFKTLPSALNGQLNINAQTGELSAEKGNTIPQGNYTVEVTAENSKGSKTATVALKIVRNRYLFTYVHWGNNIGLSPIRNYASQYRITSKGTFKMKVAASDIEKGVQAEYHIDGANSSTSATINPHTGEITFDKWQAGKVFMLLVKVTTGKGTAGEVTIKTPVFVHCSAPVGGVTVDYTPFVFQVNPKKGGTSVSPTLTGATSGKFLMDYRRAFNYYNINGPETHKTGQLKAGATTAFIYQMWKRYYGDAAVNTGARKPVSFYDNKASLNAPLCYVDATKDCAVTVNPGKWQADNEYANGVFIGQMTFTTSGNVGKVASGSQVFPLAIWFNTDF